MSTPTPPHGTESRYYGTRKRAACRCERCIRAAYYANIRRAQGRARYGSNLIDRDPVAEHIAVLLAAGMSQSAIARAANVSVSTISYLHLGKTRSCMREKALRILAVQPHADSVSPRPATGTIRRVRALYAIGHGQGAIARATGLSESAVSHIASGMVATVSGATAVAVQRAYRELAVKAGASRKARARAAAQGWHGPMAWGDDIDNPDAQPDLDTGQEAPRFVAVTEDALWLEQQGYTREQIAWRLGISRDAVQTALRRYRLAQQQNLREAA